MWVSATGVGVEIACWAGCLWNVSEEWDEAVGDGSDAWRPASSLEGVASGWVWVSATEVGVEIACWAGCLWNASGEWDEDG